MLSVAILVAFIALLGTQWVLGRLIRDNGIVILASHIEAEHDDAEYDPCYPESYYLRQIQEGVTTREQVHELMSQAKARYICGQEGNEEVYLFLTTDDDWADVVQITYESDVSNDENSESSHGSVVWTVEIPTYYNPAMPLDECAPF